MNKVTASHSILVNRPAEEVWDFTQNWNRRAEWDGSVSSAEYVSTIHPIKVKVQGKGGITFDVTYKVSERPQLTTLAMSNLNSFWIKGGGGSWKYENVNGQTRWTQHNTLVLRDDILGKLIGFLFAFGLRFTTKQMMKRAKDLIENRSPVFSTDTLTDEEFIVAFETCRITKEQWKHKDHIRMAWLYLQNEAIYETALKKIRIGIQNLNRSHGSDGYHETVTHIFAIYIHRAMQQNPSISKFDNFYAANSMLYDGANPFRKRHYSDGLWKSEQAKAKFVAPDLEPLP